MAARPRSSSPTAGTWISMTSGPSRGRRSDARSTRHHRARAQRPLWRLDDALIAEWRTRMGTVAAKAIYLERAATSECVNALARNRGLRQFVVRGVRKARAVVLWFALAHNLMRAAGLR